MEKVNLINKAVKDVYDIVIRDEVPFPAQFTDEMKVALYDAQIAFWLDYEEYEKIVVLTTKKEKL